MLWPGLVMAWPGLVASGLAWSSTGLDWSSTGLDGYLAMLGTGYVNRSGMPGKLSLTTITNPINNIIYYNKLSLSVI